MTDLVPVGPAPAFDTKRYSCRSASCDWQGMRRNMDVRTRYLGSSRRIIGLHCPKCGRWVEDA